MSKSQAQLKREKQLREALVFKLDRGLKTFEDNYVGAYTKFFINQIKKEANKYGIVLTTKEDFLALIGKTHKETGIVDTRRNTYHSDASTVSHNDAAIAYQRKTSAQLQLSRLNLLTFKFAKEACAGYTEKFNRLVDKMVAENFNPHGQDAMKIEYVQNAGYQLEILVSNSEKVFHARLIWAEGHINAPHYRFITTTRKVVVEPIVETSTFSAEGKSRKEQVQELIALGNTSPSDIAEILGANVSYVRRIMKTL